MQSPAMENTDSKAEFRKPTSETASRKYRRRSSVSGSSSSDGSPKRDRSSSPNFMRDDASKDSEPHPRRKDDERDLNRGSNRSHHSRSTDSYRYSDRKSLRSSHGYPRHDDYVRHDKYADEEKDYQRLSSRSGRDSKGGSHHEYTRRDSEHFRSRDYSRDVDKNSRDKYDGVGHKSRDNDSLSERHGSGKRYGGSEEMEKHRNVRDRDVRDEKRDYIKSSGDYKNEHVLSHEEARGNRYVSFSKREETRHHSKEVNKSEKELGDENLAKGEKKYEVRETNWVKDHYGKDLKGKSDSKGVLLNENQESPAKKSKLSSFRKEINHEQDDAEFQYVADENQSSISKQEQTGKMVSGQGQSDDAEFEADFSAAKVAAMKAAELVNKNIVGVGYMTADQKKKLLWGNKKSTVVEEPGHQWDSALFTDRERQEKFNKLMGVKGDLKTEHKPSNQDGSELRAEKQRELQMDLEKQYTAGLRRRDGRTVGLGL